MKFKTYLQNRKLSKNTIRGYLHLHKIFTTWLETTSQLAEELTYTDILDFIKSCREQNYSTHHINRLLCIIRHYYAYLKHTGKTTLNPALEIYLKGTTRRIAHDLLNAEQLEGVFTNFTQEENTGRRNQVITGLIVYQALGKWELQQLEPGHIKLDSCQIEIMANRRTNGRILQLEATQMIGIQHYLTHTRTEILTKAKKQSNKLLLSNGSGHNLANTLTCLVRILSSNHDYVRSTRQLRQSRIAIWVKQYGLRRAQVMAGHRYVSSTERYQQSSIEELKESVNRYHPLG